MVSYIVGCLVLVLCIGTSLAQIDFKWKPNSITINENGVAAISTFGYHGKVWPGGVYVCTFKREPGLTISPALGDKNNHIIFLTNKLRTATFSIKAPNDNICADKRFEIIVTCHKIINGKERELVKIKGPKLTVKVKNTDNGTMCDDPHLTQRVNGIDENGEFVTKKVCYDLYGKSGDRLELMSDNLLRTSIVFELRDDYYIGKAFYSTKLGIFNFTTTKISLPSLQMKKWGLEDNFVIGSENTYPHAVVKQSKNDVLIDYIEENRSESIRIVKIQQSYGKSYLNVLVEKSASRNGVFDENHGGIFGVIANQEYEFYESVQDEGDMAVVKVNGRFVKSFLKGSPNETDRCYTMSLEDLIFPKNAYSFQKSL